MNHLGWGYIVISFNSEFPFSRDIHIVQTSFMFFLSFFIYLNSFNAYTGIHKVFSRWVDMPLTTWSVLLYQSFFFSWFIQVFIYWLIFCLHPLHTKVFLILASVILCVTLSYLVCFVGQSSFELLKQSPGIWTSRSTSICKRWQYNLCWPKVKQILQSQDRLFFSFQLSRLVRRDRTFPEKVKWFKKK